VFYSNFVHKTHRFEICDFKNAVTLKTLVRGPSRSLKMSPFDITHMSSYWRCIVIMTLSRVVCRLWYIQCLKMSWPWNPGRGHSRSLRLVPFDRLSMISY